MTRREKEHRQRQLLLLFTGVAAVIVILALAIGAFYQYYWFPRQTVASVNGTEIRRIDYMKVRNYQIRQEIAQVSQQLQTAQPDQQPQIQARIGLLQEELADLEDNEVNLHPETVSNMINDQLVLNNLDSLGINITEAEVDQYALELLSPVPLGDPTPVPTAEPTAAAWATETAEAFNVQVTQTVEAQQTQAAQPTEEVAGTPDADSTPGPDATPEAEATEEAPAAEATPEVTPTGDAAVTPTAEAEGEPTEEAEPTETPSPTSTPTLEEAIAVSEANYDQLEDNFLEPAGMSRDDFERLIVRPALARQRAQEELAADVSARADQANLAHILVATQEAAQELLDTRLQEEEFEDVAAEVSIDTQTAPDGGNLGWNPLDAYVEEFAAAAATLDPGELSDPVQTEFGWHIIKMLDFEEDRPLTLQGLNQQRAAAFQRWLEELRENADIDSEVELPSDNPGANPVLG